MPQALAPQITDSARGDGARTDATQTSAAQTSAAQTNAAPGTPAISSLAEGRLADTRKRLRAAASPDNPQLWFRLAETYDPLAINTGSGGLANKHLADTNATFARFYYQQALTHGVTAARGRLDALDRH